MTDLDSFALDARKVAAVGNLTLPTRRWIDRFERETPAAREVCLLELSDLVERFAGDLSFAQLARVRADVSAFAKRLPRGMQCRLAPTVEALTRSAGSETPPTPGEANVLLAATETAWGERFGTCKRLAVASLPWRDVNAMTSSRLNHQPGSNLPNDAFWQGTRAAVEMLKTLGMRSLDDSLILARYGFEGSILGVRLPIDGDSLGLAAAMASLSSVLELPISRTDAFTGGIDLMGRLHAVGNLDAKLSAAAEAGIRRVFVPAKNVDAKARRRRPGEPVVELASNLADVMDTVFEPGAVATQVSRLRGLRIARPYGSALPQPAESDGPNEHWLFTCVGRSDPFGGAAGASLDQVHVEEGPILTIARTYHLDRIFLLHTTDGLNDFKERAQEVRGILESEGAVKPRVVQLARLRDPTDYTELLPAMRDAVVGITEEYAKEHAPAIAYVNVSSGTPQMEVAWHLLVERGYLGRESGFVSQAIRLQVRESRYVPEPGESRVRMAQPPLL